MKKNTRQEGGEMTTADLNTNGEKFHELIDALVALNLRHRESIPDRIRKHMHPVDWSQMFCTVSCDIGRHIGKTSYILKRAKEHDLIVTAYPPQQDAPCTILTRTNFEIGIRNKKFDTIFVDEPAKVLTGKLTVHRFYTLLLADGMIGHTFIMLGGIIR